MPQKLLVATHNKGKIAELADMMQDLQLEWVGLDDVGITHDVEETGHTFAENAWLKAIAYAQQSGLLTLADDSGLEVEALNGEPGVYTARYGGTHLSHEQRYLLLLENMQQIPPGRRTARFRCVIAIANPAGEKLAEAQGICEGEIALAPAGNYGFGYDPVFLPEGKNGYTMAQLPPAEKHPISHRGRAVAQVAQKLRQLLG
jgi:XTP/dITP diphosphohydrolase